ncbi:transposase family protein [Streptomyces sp. NPDC021080]|uniref:transposase family protein n=1 Tax=Streptomyces sp. NPDC021080 TaxID=3365110 RepID=UPI0037B1B4D8
MCRQSATVCLIKSLSPATRELSVLTDRLTAMPDPRDRRGRRHSLVAVLLTAACAVLAGVRSCLAIGQWARHAPQHTLARLGIRVHGPLGVRTPHSAVRLPPSPRPGRGLPRRPGRPARHQPCRDLHGGRGRQDRARLAHRHAGPPPTSSQQSPEPGTLSPSCGSRPRPTRSPASPTCSRPSI